MVSASDREAQKMEQMRKIMQEQKAKKAQELAAQQAIKANGEN